MNPVCRLHVPPITSSHAQEMRASVRPGREVAVPSAPARKISRRHKHGQPEAALFAACRAKDLFRFSLRALRLCGNLASRIGPSANNALGGIARSRKINRGDLALKAA
jgi:hypothetical protein